MPPLGAGTPFPNETELVMRLSTDVVFLDSEMQLFLLGFIVIMICEIFTVGGIPLDDTVRKVRINCDSRLCHSSVLTGASGLLGGPCCSYHCNMLDSPAQRSRGLPAAR